VRAIAMRRRADSGGRTVVEKKWFPRPIA
jgi:hypothetical protein